MYDWIFCLHFWKAELVTKLSGHCWSKSVDEGKYHWHIKDAASVNLLSSTVLSKKRWRFTVSWTHKYKCANLILLFLPPGHHHCLRSVLTWIHCLLLTHKACTVCFDWSLKYGKFLVLFCNLSHYLWLVCGTLIYRILIRSSFFTTSDNVCCWNILYLQASQCHSSIYLNPTVWQKHKF